MVLPHRTFHDIGIKRKPSVSPPFIPHSSYIKFLAFIPVPYQETCNIGPPWPFGFSSASFLRPASENTSPTVYERLCAVCFRCLLTRAPSFIHTACRAPKKCDLAAIEEEQMIAPGEHRQFRFDPSPLAVIRVLDERSRQNSVCAWIRPDGLSAGFEDRVEDDSMDPGSDPIVLSNAIV
jgi:hypothetical protein